MKYTQINEINFLREDVSCVKDLLYKYNQKMIKLILSVIDKKNVWWNIFCGVLKNNTPFNHNVYKFLTIHYFSYYPTSLKLIFRVNTNEVEIYVVKPSVIQLYKSNRKG